MKNKTKIINICFITFLILFLIAMGIFFWIIYQQKVISDSNLAYYQSLGFSSEWFYEQPWDIRYDWNGINFMFIYYGVLTCIIVLIILVLVFLFLKEK